MNIISSRMFARKLNRENTNPSIDEIHSVNSTAGTAMMIVLTKYLARSPCCQAATKLSKLRCVGQET